jgi:hypothetical protein
MLCAARTRIALIWSTSGLGPLDGVGGWVFTQGIEHTFEHSVNLVMQEVLL